MIIPYIISIAGNTIWALTPFKQAKTNYFYFFLVNAITSCLSLLDFIFLIHPAKIYVGKDLFLIIALFEFKKIPHYKYFILGVFALSILLPLIISVQILIYLLIVENIVIFFLILKKTILYSALTEKLNLFHFILLLLELSTITRYIVVVVDIKTGVIFYYLTAAFGILIGIYFLIFNENNSFKFALTLEQK